MYISLNYEEGISIKLIKEVIQEIEPVNIKTKNPKNSNLKVIRLAIEKPKKMKFIQ